jgi:hypothetical protein
MLSSRGNAGIGFGFARSIPRRARGADADADLPVCIGGNMSTIDGFRLDGKVAVVAGGGDAGGAIGAGAAVANAVNDALALVGAHLNEGPFTPARVVAAFQEARS